MAFPRRQFLRGLGGFTLALPFLESLAPKRASAGDPPYARYPRFVCMTTQHGGVWGANMFPGDASALSTAQLYSGHTAHWGPLAASTNGSLASISPVLSAPSAKLSPEIAARMNVIRGLDVPFYLGHHTGGDLGNYGRNDGEFDNPMEYRPTIDQVMAYSSSFYPDLSSIRQRSLHIGTHENHCWGYSNPTNQTGTIDPMPLSQSALALFNAIFVPVDDGAPQRPLVVDRVIESYRRLHDGVHGDARRLSSQDKQRLTDHMDRLRDLETSLNATADCSDVPVLAEDTNGLDVGGYSANTGDMRTFYELYNRVIVAAFTCGTSRIAVINSGETWSAQFPGLCCDWHQQVAHLAHESDGVKQQILLDSKRMFFEWVFLDLVNKLHAVKEENDMSILDNSLVFWTQEAGSTTHNPISLPIITAGSAAGAWETGRYIDYRNRQNTVLAHDYSPEHALLRPGLPYNRFLANVLQAMGVPTAEFERPGEHGYGLPIVDEPAAWSQTMMNDASLPLPLLVRE